MTDMNGHVNVCVCRAFIYSRHLSLFSFYVVQSLSIALLRAKNQPSLPPPLVVLCLQIDSFALSQDAATSIENRYDYDLLWIVL